LSNHALGIIALCLVFVATTVFMTQLDSVRYSAPQPQVAMAATVEKPAAFRHLSLIATSSIVVDVSTGQTLYESNSDVQLPLASLTKVPMAFVVSESMPADSVVTIPRDTSPTSKAQSLPAGSRWYLKDLLTYTLVASSNDGAEILADQARYDIHLRYPQSPLNTATLWRMNDLAHSLGLTHTYFLNPTGLDESITQSGAYGSAGDMATLFAYVASTTPTIYAGTARAGVHLASLDGESTVVQNTDEALDAIPGLVMGKTGFTDLAGGNLAVVFDVAPGHRIVAVVLHSTREGRFSDMKKLVEAARETFAPGVAAPQ
jgi:serine-type D-Ala-D-Ala carboxypeptidase (penicillin-binding protein 5/6)